MLTICTYSVEQNNVVLLISSVLGTDEALKEERYEWRVLGAICQHQKYTGKDQKETLVV